MKKNLKNTLRGMLVFSMFVLATPAIQAWDSEGPTIEGDYRDDMGLRNKESVTAVKEKGLWGFVKNGNGKVAIKPKYEEIGPVQNFTIRSNYGDEYPQQLIPVKLKGLWGFVDCRGKEVIKPRYETIGNFSPGIDRSRGIYDGIVRCLVKRDGQFYYIDSEGEEIKSFGIGLSDAFPVGEYTIGINNGEVNVFDGPYKSEVKASEGADYYFIRTPKMSVIRTKEDKRTYPVANVFGNGASVIYVYQLDDGTYKIAADAIKPFGPATNVVAFPAPKDPDYYGLYGVDGIFTCIKASDLSEAFHTDKNITGYLGKDNFSFTEPNASTFGIMNASGNILVPATYTSFKYGPSGVVVAQKDGKYGVISPENKELVPFIYKEISDWGNNVVCVFDGSTLGVYNLADNTWRLPLGKYTGYGKKLWKDRAMWVRNGDKWGVSLPDYSREIVPPIYSKNEISEGFKTTFDNKNFTVHIKRNGTVSVVNYDGETIIPFGRYDGIKGYDHKYVCVTKGNKVGLVNRYTGKQIIPAIHDKIEAEGNGKIMATDRTNTGFIAYIYDANGKLVHKEARQRSTSYSNASFIKNWLGLCSEFDFTL